MALFVLLYGGFLTLKIPPPHEHSSRNLGGMRFKKINPSISTSRVILKFKGLHIFAIFLRYQDSANAVSDSGELVSALYWIKAPLSEMNKVAMIHWI